VPDEGRDSQNHGNSPVHHRLRRVFFVDIYRNIAADRLADPFAVEPEERPLSNPHSPRQRPAAQFNALLSAIPGASSRAGSVPHRG